MISGGKMGRLRHSHWPKRASQILVKMRTLGTPPLERTKARAFSMRGSSGDTPASLRAK
jgi:hypothetical protein